MGGKNDHWLQGSSSKLQLKTPYLRSRFLIWRTANILQQSRLLGRLNKNAVESVVDGMPCTSFENPGSDFAFGNCHPKAHSNCHECSHFPVSQNIQRGRNMFHLRQL